MDVTTHGTWFSNAGTLGTIGLVGALVCALLAVVFLVKQYKGHQKAPKITKFFLILGLIFLLIARFAPQENKALSDMHEESGAEIEHSLEESATALFNEAKQALGLGEAHEDNNSTASPNIEAKAHALIEEVGDTVHDFDHQATHDIEDVIHQDNKEIHSLEDDFTQEMNEDEAELNAGIHGGIETEADEAINEIVGDVQIDNNEQNSMDPSTSDTSFQTDMHSLEEKALITMRHNALESAQAVSGVHSAQWNESMLPDLQLDVVADVTPESAVPLMNKLCTALTENTLQPTSVSIKDLEGGHIARQMCGTLVQGVE